MQHSGRRHTLAAASLLAAIAACGEGVTAPRIVATTPAVTTDRTTYALSTYTKAGIQYFIANGAATFHNITNRAIYLPRACVPAPATMWLQRDDGTRVGLIDDASCAILVAYDGTPQPIVVAPGDSLVQSFTLWTYVRAPVTDAQIASITGEVRLFFDVSAVPNGHTPVPGLDSAMNHSASIVIEAQ